MENPTASDRASLIKLASSLPVGDRNRRVILSSLKKSAFSLYQGRWNPAKNTMGDLEGALWQALEEYAGDTGVDRMNDKNWLIYADQLMVGANVPADLRKQAQVWMLRRG